MPRVFLAAEWRDLIIASYAVNAELLIPRLPPGLELDRFDGKAVCSLVGFRFLQTRVFGVKWPGLVNFPEINLRFYVRDPATGRRGVVFIRELVKSRLVASVARTLYNEPYFKAEIGETIDRKDSSLILEYDFSVNGGRGSIGVEAHPDPFTPPEDSAEHWFKEHQWGYGVSKRGKPIRYEVRHPVWACHEVRWSSMSVNWARVYGPEWEFLHDQLPLSVVLAVGSRIEVCTAERAGTQ
ncbi:MAG: YqjF family protein [Phycisphaerales bacterium]